MQGIQSAKEGPLVRLWEAMPRMTLILLAFVVLYSLFQVVLSVTLNKKETT